MELILQPLGVILNIPRFRRQLRRSMPFPGRVRHEPTSLKIADDAYSPVYREDAKNPTNNIKTTWHFSPVHGDVYKRVLARQPS